MFVLLFVADSPVSSESLQSALNFTEGQVQQALELLDARLNSGSPLRLARLAGGFQLSTRPEYAEVISTFLKPQRPKISKSLMEVLAIVAYRQPITMSEIELVRGVQSDYALRALVERKLIEEVGRKPVPGRPVLYGTTPQFLHSFNLNDLSELPVLASQTELPTLPRESKSE